MRHREVLESGYASLGGLLGVRVVAHDGEVRLPFEGAGQSLTDEVMVAAEAEQGAALQMGDRRQRNCLQHLRRVYRDRRPEFDRTLEETAELRVRQGEAMGRPSELRLRIEHQDRRPRRIRVGGPVTGEPAG